MIIKFLSTNINHLPEGVFKSILDYENNLIDFSKKSIFNSKIDCEDCKNYWLIKEKKENQVFNAYCKGDITKTLFDKQIQDKLSQKCKLTKEIVIAN